MFALRHPALREHRANRAQGQWLTQVADQREGEGVEVCSWSGDEAIGMGLPNDLVVVSGARQQGCQQAGQDEACRHHQIRGHRSVD